MRTKAERLEQMRESSRRYRANHPERVKRTQAESRHRLNYGITIDQKWSLLDDQGGCCACCRARDPGRRGWHVDHDHKTGRVRGILCGHCNSALGFARDDIATLQRLIDYLRKEPAT